MLTIAYKARLIWRRHLANVSGSISGVSLLSTQTRPAASQQTALLQRVAQLAASALEPRHSEWSQPLLTVPRSTICREAGEAPFAARMPHACQVTPLWLNM
jgi:hypothetical protein